MRDTIPDPAAILEALRAEVRARRQAGVTDDDPAQSAIDRELHRCAEQLEITRVVSAHWPLEGRNLFERAGMLVNKVVRRLLRWYINPIVEQQNAFNDVSTRTLRLLIEAQGELRAQLNEIERGESGAGDRGTAVPAESRASPRSPLPAPAPPTDDLQALVAECARAEPPAPLTDLALRPLTARLAERQAVNAHWPLVGRTPVEQLAALVHKGMRRYLRWLINPIVDQQNAFNAALTAAIPPLLGADAFTRARLAALRARRKNL